MIHMHDPISLLAHALAVFNQQKRIEFEWSKSRGELATKSDLRLMEKHIMSAISDFAAKQTAFNVRQGAAIDGLVVDVDKLNAKIEELQNSPGAITAADQALLDQLETQGDALATRLESLDAQTPPVPPAA